MFKHFAWIISLRLRIKDHFLNFLSRCLQIIQSHKVIARINLQSLICLQLLIAGCATVIDTLPPGTPKGYVEFYYSKDSATFYLQIGRHESFEDKGGIIHDFPCAPKGYLSSWDHRLRIAETPGFHDYCIVQKVYQPIKVEVIEGMITPVRIHIQVVGSTKELTGVSNKSVFHKITRYGVVSHTVEPPIPIK